MHNHTPEENSLYTIWRQTLKPNLSWVAQFACSILFLLILAACAPNSKTMPVREPPVSVDLQVRQPAADDHVNHRLNLNIVVFDPGMKADTGDRGQIDSALQLRQAESRYLPFVLKQTLQKTNAWGAVRVLPRSDPTSELEVSGRLIKSDGLELQLAIKAIDSTGSLWLDKRYTDRATASDYPENIDRLEESFQDLFNQIANDLLIIREQMDHKSIQRLVDVSQLRYAAELAPDAFTDYFSIAHDGTISINRLPSREDSILARVDKIRDSEYLFIDTLDEHYSSLFDRMSPTYKLWRKFNHDYTMEKERHEQNAQTERRSARSGLAEMREIYRDYQESQYQEEALIELSSTFNSEFEPVVMQVNQQIVKLSGNIDERYLEWRRLLKQIFEQEVGLD